MIPAEKTSPFAVYGKSEKTSGAIYPGVPALLSNC